MRILLTLIIGLFVTLFFLASCGNNRRGDGPNKRISELEQINDDSSHGPESLLAEIKLSFEKGRYYDVKEKFLWFEVKYPDSPEYIEANAIRAEVTIIEAQKKLEAEIAKQARAKEAEKAKQEKEMVKLSLLKKLIKNHDDIEGVTWYYQQYFTHYIHNNLVSIYMGERNNHRWLRLKMTYSGSDWIFFEKAYLSYEGNTFEVPFDRYENKETNLGSGGFVREWIDVVVTKDMEDYLNKFANSTDAKMRLSGKFSKTRNLTKNERQGILDILNVYQTLN